MQNCTGGLSVSLTPAQPKVGDTVTVKIGLMNSGDQDAFKSMGADIKIWVVNDSFFGSNDIRLNKSFSGNSFEGSFLVGGPLITKAGSYKLKTEVYYQVTGAITQMYSFSQENSITVLAADTTGGPKLNVNTSESFANGPDITKGITWTYLDGGSGKQAASFKVDCGDTKGPQSVGSGQASFRCIYPKGVKNYSVSVYAYDSSGAQLAVQGASISVTGEESTQGAGNNPGSGEEGGPLRGIISKIVGFLLGIIQEIIYGIFYLFLVPVIQAMLSIRVYTDTFVSVIYPGWIVLRNLCNIIFIVAIMAIAMGTLLRVDAYKSRGVLVQLILAALLVNFSLVIAQIILGVADTVQNQFLPNNQEVIRALGKDLMVAYRSEVLNLEFTGYFSEIVKHFMLLTMSAGSFMVFAAIAVFLFIRMIMLWILLLLSPIAYAAGALPSTSHYRKEWWTTFLKYAFFTPIMAFFLNMTAIISNTYKANPIFGALGVKDSDFGNSTIAGFVFRVGSTLLLIVFLIVALKVAESFSIYGASEVSKFAKKGMFAPIGIAGKLAKAGAERGFEGVQNTTGITMDPRIWKHEFEEYFEKQKKNRMLAREAKKLKGVPFGAPRDMLENYWNTKGVKRVWKSRFGLDGYARRFKKANEEYDKATRVLTDDEQKAQEAEQARLTDARVKIDKQVIGAANFPEFGKGLDEIVSALEKRANAVLAEEAKLRNSGDVAGANKKKADADAILARKDALLAQKGTVQAAIASGGDFDASGLNATSADFKAAFDKHNSDVAEGLEDVSKKLDDNKKYRDLYKISEWKSGDKTQALKDYKDFKERAEEVERPEAYYARAARLEREQDESKKISHIHDEGELNKLLRNAIRQKDAPKAVAILKKLTRDRNLNEVLEDFGYATSFEDHVDSDGNVTPGVKQFFIDKVQGDLGMEREEMLEVATEVGYEAEESKQYNASRLTWIDPSTGHLDFNGYTEHSTKLHPSAPTGGQHRAHVLTEARKSEPRKRFGELPRWCYVVEAPDALGERKRLGFTDIGKDLLLDACGNDEVIRNIKSQGNTFSMKAIADVAGWKDELLARGKERGITPEEVKKLTEAIEIAAGKGN